VRIFLDTNVLASSIATRGLCSELPESVIHDHELLTCQPVLRELKRVLTEKFRLPGPVVEGFLALLKTEARVVVSQKTPSVPIKDADDIPILACAIAGEAEVFVTGDKELLDLQKIGTLPIASPRQLWLQLAGLEAPRKGK
jgi:putative PIN family toxin of toxin-antitoxin system